MFLRASIKCAFCQKYCLLSICFHLVSSLANLSDCQMSRLHFKLPLECLNIYKYVHYYEIEIMNILQIDSCAMTCLKENKFLFQTITSLVVTNLPSFFVAHAHNVEDRPRNDVPCIMVDNFEFVFAARRCIYWSGISTLAGASRRFEKMRCSKHSFVDI